MLIYLATDWRPICGIAHSRLFIALLATAAFGWSSCSQDVPTEPVGRPHIVFILVDTLRLDHTSIGGYDRDTTPGLQAIAKEGLRFEHHFANAPWTKPSVATILTGLSPGAHGAQWGQKTIADTHKVDLLAEGFETFPEVLQQYGYRTHAFMTNTTLSASLGYAQGFDEYELLKPGIRGDRRASALTKQTLNQAKEPTLIWCHLMGVHNYQALRNDNFFNSDTNTPLNKRAPFAKDLVRRFSMKYHEDAIDRYDGTVLLTDRLIENLTQFIRKNHPDTLIVITSDHGEEFLDHGGYLHARTLYNEILRVPLVLVGPGIPSGRSVSRLTDHTDLFATLLDYLDLPPSATQGESLLLEHSGEGETIYAEKRNGAFAQRALITEDGKIIERKPKETARVKPKMAGKGRWEFYRDPTGPDNQNVLSELPATAIADARAQFERIWEGNQTILSERTQGYEIQREMTEEELEALRELGYAE
jgi:arylsulfatase A-like enzyme